MASGLAFCVAATWALGGCSKTDQPDTQEQGQGQGQEQEQGAAVSATSRASPPPGLLGDVREMTRAVSESIRGRPAMPPVAPPAAGREIPTHPGALTPQEAVAMAIGRHPEIRGADAVIARRQADLALARAQRWPSLTYGVGPGYGGYYGSGGNQFAVRANVGIQLPVWDFGATSSRIAAATSQGDAAVQTRAATAERVAAATVDAYVEAAVARDRMVAATEAIQAMRNVVERINQRVQAGLSDRSDLNAASIAVTRAEVDSGQARAAAEAAMSRLVQLIGVTPNELAPLEASQQLMAARDRTEPDFETTPAIQAANRAYEAAVSQERAARADLLPGFSLSASRTFSTGRYSANDSTWMGLALNGTFSLGGAGRRRVEAASADRRAAEQDLEARRLEARTNWQVAGRQESGARQRRQELQSVSTLWTTTRDLYWEEYILDKRPLRDVINAEREIYTARQERIVALGETVSAAVRGLVAQGGLLAFLEQAPGRDQAPPVTTDAQPSRSSDGQGPALAASRSLALPFGRQTPVTVASLPAPSSPERRAPAVAASLPPATSSGRPAPVMAASLPPSALPERRPPVTLVSLPPATSPERPAPAMAASLPPPTPSERRASAAAARSAASAQRGAAMAANSAPTGAGWRVQLGLFSANAQAEALWETLKTRSSLAGLSPVFARSGPFTRLLSGPFGNEASARGACAALSASGHGNCVVIAPAPDGRTG
jgi:adhesin transport system outer membrane protein